MSNTLIFLAAWISVATLLAFKWERANTNRIDELWIITLCVVFCPIVLIVSIVRQLILEEWH